ncbi:hypothetical protein ACOSP7_020922 [Xanthoceras sorbifolium]
MSEKIVARVVGWAYDSTRPSIAIRLSIMLHHKEQTKKRKRSTYWITYFQFERTGPEGGYSKTPASTIQTKYIGDHESNSEPVTEDCNDQRAFNGFKGGPSSSQPIIKPPRLVEHCEVGITKIDTSQPSINLYAIEKVPETERVSKASNLVHGQRVDKMKLGEEVNMADDSNGVDKGSGGFLGPRSR